MDESKVKDERQRAMEKCLNIDYSVEPVTPEQVGGLLDAGHFVAVAWHSDEGLTPEYPVALLLLCQGDSQRGSVAVAARSMRIPIYELTGRTSFKESYYNLLAKGEHDAHI